MFSLYAVTFSTLFISTFSANVDTLIDTCLSSSTLDCEKYQNYYANIIGFGEICCQTTDPATNTNDIFRYKNQCVAECNGVNSYFCGPCCGPIGSTNLQCPDLSLDQCSAQDSTLPGYCQRPSDPCRRTTQCDSTVADPYACLYRDNSGVLQCVPDGSTMGCLVCTEPCDCETGDECTYTDNMSNTITGHCVDSSWGCPVCAADPPPLATTSCDCPSGDECTYTDTMSNTITGHCVDSPNECPVCTEDPLPPATTSCDCESGDECTYDDNRGTVFTGHCVDSSWGCPVCTEDPPPPPATTSCDCPSGDECTDTDPISNTIITGHCVDSYFGCPVCTADPPVPATTSCDCPLGIDCTYKDNFGGEFPGECVSSGSNWPAGSTGCPVCARKSDSDPPETTEADPWNCVDSRCAVGSTGSCCLGYDNAQNCEEYGICESTTVSGSTAQCTSCNPRVETPDTTPPAVEATDPPNCVDSQCPVGSTGTCCLGYDYAQNCEEYGICESTTVSGSTAQCTSCNPRVPDTTPPAVEATDPPNCVDTRCPVGTSTCCLTYDNWQTCQEYGICESTAGCTSCNPKVETPETTPAVEATDDNNGGSKTTKDDSTGNNGGAETTRDTTGGNDGGSETTKDDSTGNNGGVETTEKEEDCHNWSSYTYNQPCEADPGTGCALKIRVSLKLCVIIPNVWNNQYIYRHALGLLMWQYPCIGCGSICDKNSIYFTDYDLHLISDSSLTGNLNDNTPSSTDDCPLCGDDNDLKYQLDATLIVRCASCDNLQERALAVWEAAEAGTLGPDFSAQCLAYSLSYDEQCGIGFGRVKAEGTITVAMYDEQGGEILIREININGNDASQRGYYVGVVIVFAVLSLFI